MIHIQCTVHVSEVLSVHFHSPIHGYIILHYHLKIDGSELDYQLIVILYGKNIEMGVNILLHLKTNVSVYSVI